MTLTVVNPHIDRPVTTEIAVSGVEVIASYTGTVLVGADVHVHNDFAHPNAVHPSAPHGVADGRPVGSYVSGR